MKVKNAFFFNFIKLMFSKVQKIYHNRISLYFFLPKKKKKSFKDYIKKKQNFTKTFSENYIFLIAFKFVF